MEGSRLKKLREDKGFSLNKFSELTGISKSYLSFLERDIQNNPTLDVLAKISKVLEVDIDYLVRKENDDPEEVSEVEKNVIKVEIEISEEQLTPENFDKIKELINMFNNDKA